MNVSVNDCQGAAERACAWVEGAEQELRACLTAALSSELAREQAVAWQGLGDYLLTRSQPAPALIAFDLAAQTGHPTAAILALRGVVRASALQRSALTQAAAFGLLASTDAIDDLWPLVQDLREQTAKQALFRASLATVMSDAGKCAGVLAEAVARARDEVPDFEERFLSGQLTYDDPTTVFAMLRSPSIENAPGLAAATERTTRLVRRRSHHRRQAPVVLACLAMTFARHRMEAVSVTPKASLATTLYAIWWLHHARTLQKWIDLARDQEAMQRRPHSTGTHGVAYDLLEQFASRRAPFGLLLRGFEGEAWERVASAEAPLIRNGVEHLGMIGGMNQDHSPVESWLAEDVAHRLPFLTGANPAALPSGRLPRLEMAHSQWERAVNLTMSAADCIVVECTVGSPSLRRELAMLRLTGCASKTLIIVPGTSQRQRLTEDRDFVSLSTGVSGLTWPRILTVKEPLLQGFLNVISGDLLEQDGEVPLPRRTRAPGPDP